MFVGAQASATACIGWQPGTCKRAYLSGHLLQDILWELDERQLRGSFDKRRPEDERCLGLALASFAVTSGRHTSQRPPPLGYGAQLWMLQLGLRIDSPASVLCTDLDAGGNVPHRELRPYLEGCLLLLSCPEWM